MKALSVLLVDDNPAFVREAATFLRTQENPRLMIIGTASNGHEAMSQVRMLRPQLVLLDLSMPGMSGLEALPHLRVAFPGVRIIVLTLFDSDAYRQATLAAGADDFVSKLGAHKDLLRAIRRLFSASETECVDCSRANPGARN